MDVERDVRMMADRGQEGIRPRRQRQREGAPRVQVGRHTSVKNACVCSCGWGLGALVLLCAVSLYISPPSSKETWVEDEDVRSFEHLIDVMTRNDLGAIEELPIIIEAGGRKIEGGLDIFLSSGIADGDWRMSVVDKSYEVLSLYREAKESVYEVALRGRSLMQDMVDQNLDEIQRAFDEGKYEIIRMRLDDVREELTEASEALATAKVKLTNAVATTDDILKLIHLKTAEKQINAKGAKQGWGAGNSAVAYTFGMAVGAAAAVLAPYAVPLAYGVAAGAGYGAAAGVGLTGLYQFTDALDRQGLQQRFHSEAQELSAAGGKVKNAREIIHQCTLGVGELQLAVEAAQKSTGKMSGHLKPEDANTFKNRLSDAKRNYKKLLARYEETVKSIQSGSFKSKRLA